MAINYDKLRLLRIMQILWEETDEQHPLSASGILKRLSSRYDMSADRKTIYSDIELLNLIEIEMDIVHTIHKNGGFYIGTRSFELAELKLMVDAVQSSKFITKKKSEDLIKKLGKMTSKEEASILRRQVFIYNRTKADNETIYYSVDKIHTAIHENRKISFQYCVWNLKKELEPKKSGMRYIVSPHAVSWDDENYYLVAYDSNEAKIKHYRVDKIQDAQIEDEEREGKREFENFDLAAYAKKTFGMYGGYDEDVSFLCDNKMIGVMIDRFGQDIMVIPQGKDRFHTRATVTVSRQFFGWLTAIGSGVMIEGPERVREEYKKYLQETVNIYQ